MTTPASSATEIRDAVTEGRASAVEICRAALERMQAANAALNAFNLIDTEGALARAERVDRQRASGAALGPLAGVPVALKDNLCVRGMRTTASSKILDTFIAPYDATVVQRLEAAGAVIVGKTNCDEFAMGSSNENSAYGPVRNPWAADRTPGGSSGGSAAAVAARCVPLALGSDTGGSIRQPASFCGVVGLKPTYGRVSRYGLLAFASSLDQIGPFTRTVADAALTLSVLAGPDAADSTSSAEAVPDFTAALTGELRGARIGVPRALVTEGVDDTVRGAYEQSLETLRDAGATLVDIELPHARYAIPTYYLVCTAEASSNLARYDGVKYGYRARAARDGVARVGVARVGVARVGAAGDGAAGDGAVRAMYMRSRAEGFGPEVKRRIMLGTYVLSAGYYDAFYLKAQQVRTLLRRDYEQAFERVDVVAMPTSPTPPFRLGEKTDDPLQMYLADVFTVSANLTGHPGISVPGGFDGELPIGLQLIGRMFEESTVLRVADAYERATTWHTRVPPI